MYVDLSICLALSLSLSLSLSLYIYIYAYGASIAQLAESRSWIRKALSSILASATTEWVTKKSSPKVCGGISNLKSHRSSGPPQPLSKNNTTGWSNRREKS